MINSGTLKGIVTYKSALKENVNKTTFIEFGLAFNSSTRIPKVYKIVCQAKDEMAKFFSSYISVKDIIIINYFVTTRVIDCKEISIYNVKAFEPIKTNRNITLSDKAIDESLYAKHIRGFDE